MTDLRLLEQAVLSLVDGVVISDATREDNPLVYVNPGFEQLTGYSAAEALGRNCRFLHQSDPDQPELDTVRRAIAEARPCLVTLRNYRRDGSLFWNELSLSPVHSAAGDVTHFIAIQKDVTAQMLAQEALRDSQRSLQQANEAIERANQELERRVRERTAELLETQQALLRKERLAAIGTFAASIVHEIRSPLSTIALALQHVGRLELAPGSDKRVRLASEETTRLERLLSEILLYARPQESKLESVDLGAVVASSVAEVRQMPASRDRRIAFEPRDLPTIDGSRDKLHQVFLNLLVNACEASPEGGTVTVRLERPEGVNQLRVSVHNGGPPIPRDLADTVTRAFCTTKPAGTGLGLSIVQRIVDAHRGRLAFESSEESGTTFTVELPLTP